MKMFRPALVGVLPAFVLLVCVQLDVRAASTPLLPEMQSWFTGDDTVKNHIWQSTGPLSSGATYATDTVAAPSQSRQLCFEDRVVHQRAIEEVYWRHRIWPKERPDPKPALDTMMSQAAIEQKVQDYLRHSELLEQEWQKPITPEQLQAEMERMTQHSKQPEVLRELFAALGNDPFVIAECLARPVLLERLQFAKAESGKEPFESWSARAQNQMPNVMSAATASYTLPVISNQPSDCIDDSWTATSPTVAPKEREIHTAVWTGTEMIVWGGQRQGDHSIFLLNTGGRYNPSTDSWAPTSTTNAPAARSLHTAVWTGSEMIVWGGDNLNTGGRYNPSTDSWTPTSTTGAPTGRYSHTAVWTGSEMIVWGGSNMGVRLASGGRYNPITDSWTATTTDNAPSSRNLHTAVWTGSEMIVWGGQGITSSPLKTGGRYNPSTDNWTPTSTTNAPTGRYNHTAVWTDSEMIVWGGIASSGAEKTGARYNPVTDSWTSTSTTNVPDGRESHTAVWTNSEMIVWGGIIAYRFGYFNSGGRYNPSTDSWTVTSTTNVPSARTYHTAVWTGTEMIVWGGEDETVFDVNTGGRYCAQTGGPIMLSAAKRKVGGINTVRLTWSGATSTDIDVYRDAVLIVTTANDGSYTDSTGDTGRARYTYKVCEAGTQTCSNEVTVRFPQ